MIEKISEYSGKKSCFITRYSSYSTVFVALKRIASTLVQELKPRYPQKRLRFCEWFSNFISCQCQGAAVLDNFHLATKHGFIELGTLMQKIIDFGAVKV